MARKKRKNVGGAMSYTSDSNVIKEAKEKNTGGSVAAFKEGGKVACKKAGGRLDKRARGGRTGADKSPFSSAYGAGVSKQ